jgi:hypothetical protein
MLSQLSGEVSNAIASRNAIEGLTPDLPLSSSDKALRVTPRPLAEAVTNAERLEAQLANHFAGMRRVMHGHRGTPPMIVETAP